MRPHDDALLDSVAVLALGALPEPEAREAAAHVRSCEVCRVLYAELRPVADLVGLSAPAGATDELTSARMKARLLSVVRSAAPAALAPAAVRDSGRRRSSAAWFGAAAAVLLAALIGADDVAVRARAHDSVAVRQSDVAALTALLAPGRHFGVPQGEVFTHDGHVYIAMHVPAAPSGKVYQAWTLAKGAKAVAPSVTFVPAADGVAFVELPVDAAGLAAVAVSIEPAGGSKAPTSTPKFVRKLS